MLPHFQEDDLRLLFLDVDDVLVSVKHAVAFGRYPFPATLTSGDGYHPITGAPTNRRTFLDEPPVHDVDSFDRAAVVLINKLCTATKTHIVLSSTWRIGLYVDDIREMLDYIGINKDRVIGRTPSGNPEWRRGHEIRYFLKELGSDIDSLIDSGFVVPSLYGKSVTLKSYVILDDGTDFLDDQQANFVQVPVGNGLRIEDIEKAGKILAGPDFNLDYLQ